LRKLTYRTVKTTFQLSAQMVIRLLAKVADSYQTDRQRQRRFRLHGSVAYDARILRYLQDAVSIWTVDGRQTIPFICGERQRALLSGQRGESDLVYRDRRWYLLATVVEDDATAHDAVDWLGIDCGVVNIAVDSDGTIYAG